MPSTRQGGSQRCDAVVSSRGAGLSGITSGAVGDDLIYGFGGNDTITVSSGNGTVGAAADQTLLGLEGNDTIYGGSGNDVLEGGAGNDWLEGNNGNDTLIAGSGADVLKGGGGDDIYVYSAGLDYISDNLGGTDTLWITGGVTINDISVSNVSTYDTKVKVTAGVDEITVSMIRYPTETYHVETIKFDDGFYANLPSYNSWLNGTSGNDIIAGNANDTPPALE